MKTADKQATSTLGARACCLCAVAALALPAVAHPGERERERDNHPQQAAPRAEPRQERPAAPRQERPAAERPVKDETFRRDGRLTPDERGDLRRQIKEAGQELYAPAPPRR